MVEPSATTQIGIKLLWKQMDNFELKIQPKSKPKHKLSQTESSGEKTHNKFLLGFLDIF